MNYKKRKYLLVVISLFLSNILLANNACPQSKIKDISDMAHKGNVLNQLTMAILYQHGICVDKNISKTIKWLEMSSNEGYAPSNYLLGDLYYFGQDIKEDYQKSENSYKNILFDSNSEIWTRMGYIYTQYGKKTDLIKAKKFYSLGAEKDHPIALYSLGMMYASGLGTDRNITKAIKYFEKVLVNNSTLNTVRPETMYFLAKVLYKKNKILYKDRIIDLIKKAASQNYADAQVMLGEGYLLGEDVEKNITKAKYWIKKAIDQNNTKAIVLWKKYEFELK